MGNVAYQTVSELLRAGHDVRVYTPDYFDGREIRPASAPEAAHDAHTEAHISAINRVAPELKYGNAARLGQLKRELEDVDVVHLHYPFFGTANIVRKWRLADPRRRLVLTYHMDTRAPGWKGMIFAMYARHFLPKMLDVADACVASSFDYILHSDAATHFKANPDKWHELAFGVDQERFAPRSPDMVWYEQLGLDPTRPTILFVGGMDEAHYFKGVDHLLDALKLLKDGHLHFQAIFVGDGVLRERYELHASGMGLESRVRFVGKVGDDLLPSYYNLADVLVLPSIHQGEAFGMVLLEAFASGVPVVASDLPGVRTVAAHAGVVTPPKDAFALANGIMTVLEQRELGRVARQAAEDHFRWDARTEKLIDIYGTLVG